MGDKNDGLSLDLGLSLGYAENANANNNNNDNETPLKVMHLMHKRPHQSLQNQRVSFNTLFHLSDGTSKPRSFLRGIDVNAAPPPSLAVASAGEEENGVSSPNSTLSSISGKKREREAIGDDTDAAERASCTRGSGSDDDGGGDGENSRKKLRLSKEQALVLEDTFKDHNTLNPKQKQALANQLKLRPRQVEVWFQNRRARTKLKQTEVDCEYLKICCENLSEENRRLQKEVQELRTLKLSPQLYMHMNPPTTLTMCPSCQRVGVSSTSSSSPATMPSAPALANCNRLGLNIQRPVPMNRWVPMQIQHRQFDIPTSRP
ncbi:unnamed protein product [Lupinus luteus]|uniref:Homeobox domain-containing protein n=1 Tax=Lupinus luteus TaxID=3873 RepID=A0AAV1Y6E2_LUPLU